MRNKLMTLTDNPITNIEKSLGRFFDIMPVFHDLDQIYRTGDQVRFNEDENGLAVEIDLPGVRREDLDLTTDSQSRDVYISAKRTITADGGRKEQKYNRSFGVGHNYNLDEIVFKYNDGVLDVSIPRRNKEEHVRKHRVIELTEDQDSSE